LGSDKDDNGKIDQELLEAALRRLLGNADGGQVPPPPGWGYPPAGQAGGWWVPPGTPPYAGAGAPPWGGAMPPPPPGYPAGVGQGAAQPGSGFQQALIWAALGAAVAWVLSDPEVRDKLIKQAMKLYGELVVGIEEMKEKVSDMKAEVDAGFTRNGDG
jgi:hypothetical protein